MLPKMLSAELRTWRNQETATAIVAELVAVEGKNAILRLENGRKFSVPMERLHKDDQSYIKAWRPTERPATVATASDAAVRRAISIDIEEVTAKSDTKRTSKSKKSVSSTRYDIEVFAARNGPKIKGLTLRYVIYKRVRRTDTKTSKNNSSKIIQASGSLKVNAMEPGTSRILKTKAVSTTDSTTEYQEKKKGGSKSGKGNNNKKKNRTRRYEKRQSESVMGIIVDVFAGGTQLMQVEEPSGLSRSVGRED